MKHQPTIWQADGMAGHGCNDEEEQIRTWVRWLWTSGAAVTERSSLDGGDGLGCRNLVGLTEVVQHDDFRWQLALGAIHHGRPEGEVSGSMADYYENHGDWRGRRWWELPPGDVVRRPYDLAAGRPEESVIRSNWLAEPVSAGGPSPRSRAGRREFVDNWGGEPL